MSPAINGASVVAKPDIVTLVNKLEGQRVVSVDYESLAAGNKAMLKKDRRSSGCVNESLKWR